MTEGSAEPGPSPADGVERIVIRARERRFPLRGGFVFTTEAGALIGEYRVHLARPSIFRGPAGEFTFHQKGFLVPRFTARDSAGDVASVDHNLVTGALDVIVDGQRFPVEKEGLLRQRLRLVDESGRVRLRVDVAPLLSGKAHVTLRPGTRWTRRRLVALVALLVHVRVRARVLTTVGFGSLAPGPPFQRRREHGKRPAEEASRT